jgi:hypothetical protein
MYDSGVNVVGVMEQRYPWRSDQEKAFGTCIFGDIEQGIGQ